MTPRPPVPPFIRETAIQKVRAAEDAWNTRDPARVPAGYRPNSRWRNRDEFFSDREAIAAFLTRKWARELDYRLIKKLWAFTDNRIAVRALYTNPTTQRDSGGVVTAMRIGCLTLTDTRPSATPASTTCGSPSPNAFFVGCRAAGRTIIRA
jgi:nuclear transport factor 2 (NTF2) superfamily protein